MAHYQITIKEMAARDGLQNEAINIPTETKVAFINQLSACGLQHIEVSSFVNPQRIPQLADAEQVFSQIQRQPGVQYSALVPNVPGLTRAMAVNVDAIAVFTAASEMFCQRNINCSIEQSLIRFSPMIDQARQTGLAVRAYVSCVLGCPYEGYIAPAKVAALAKQLFDMGCAEISLGDTIGAGTPLQAQQLINEVAEKVPIEHLAVHFHDTRGQALANILACLSLGIRVIDSAVSGLGGCPYAVGATGNVATEDVIYMLHGMGYETGIDLDKLIAAGQYMNSHLQRQNNSRVAVAGVPYDYENYKTPQ